MNYAYSNSLSAYPVRNSAPSIFIGLDLGQRRDHTAIAVVDKTPSCLLVRHAERVTLGTPYAHVVDRLRQIVDHPTLAGACSLTVDATGVGAPVVELLTQASLGCEITPITITGGERELKTPNGWSVPKRDLMTGLRLTLENGDLKIARRMKESGALCRELTDVRISGAHIGAEGAGRHDDLVIALALALWQARRPPRKAIDFIGGGRLF
jgi:phage FluMu gp28-like protein